MLMKRKGVNSLQEYRIPMERRRETVDGRQADEAGGWEQGVEGVRRSQIEDREFQSNRSLDDKTTLAARAQNLVPIAEPPAPSSKTPAPSPQSLLPIYPQSVDSGIGSQAEFGAIGKVMLAWSWAWGEGEALRGPTPSGAGRDRSRRLARHISPSRFKLSAKTRSQIRR
jgi:hypothetical protein